MVEDEPCERCGQPHTRCAAHNVKGGPCGRPPSRGQRVCKKHGGGSPQALAAAEERLEQQAAEQATRSFGLPIDIDPHTALLQELKRTAGAVEWLGQIVSGLDERSIVWGVVEQVRQGSGQFPGVDSTVAARPSVWYELWSRERKHLTEVAKACVTAGIEERRIVLAETQGRMLAGVVQRVLDRLGLSEEQRQLVSVVVPEEFRAIESGGGQS